MLRFAETKALGERGLYWLKVHLANLAGKDKSTFDERASFTDRNMENIRASVKNPLGDSSSDDFGGGDNVDCRWWMSLEEPFQALATCREIVAALDSGNPESYQCGLPVHMDGSCNGLQHYAALGRDRAGGKAVNLFTTRKRSTTADDKMGGDESNLGKEEGPSDVYAGVMKEVVRRVGEEARIRPNVPDENDGKSTMSSSDKVALRNWKAASLVDGLIDRGVVKRTGVCSLHSLLNCFSLNISL